MKLLSRLIISFISNLIALLTAGYFVKGFIIAPDIKNFIIVTAVFTLINVFLRPLIKAILSPIIILTLGLGIILVNALTLYLLDIFLAQISIEGLIPLFYATLIISAVNIVIHFAAKRMD
jgi:putative membrane protein